MATIMEMERRRLAEQRSQSTESSFSIAASFNKHDLLGEGLSASLEIDPEEIIAEVNPTDVTRVYLAECNRQYRPLEKAEELMLAKGMQEARERLDYFGALPEETISFPEAIEEARKTYDRCRSTLSDSYLKMIVSMARRYVGKGCHWMI